MLLVGACALLTLGAVDATLHRVAPPVHLLDVDEAVEQYADGDPTAPVLSSSHARSFVVVGEIARARSEGRVRMQPIPVEWGKYTPYAWVLEHRIRPVMEERDAAGNLVRPSLKHVILVTEWWDSTLMDNGAGGILMNLPARSWQWPDFAADVLHNNLTPYNTNFLQKIYWERAPACRDGLAYATFVGFFPQLLAGPIVRARAMLPQYGEARRLVPDHLSAGAMAFLVGFVLKAFVADWLAPRVVDPVFADPAAYTTGVVWISLLGYATQLFGDFAGYSLMAIGVGRLFGLTLPDNFHYPLLSKSLAEFWRRWHITLNTWLFDYLFAPLTTGRSWFRGRAGWGFLVVFLVSGLWHGATWTFVLWGLAHGVALAGHHAYDQWYKGRCRKDRAWVVRRKSHPYLAASWALTQVFFVLTLVPFRAPSIGHAAAFGKGLLGFGGQGGLDHRFGFQAAACVGVFLLFHALEVGPGPRVKQRFAALPAPIRGMVYGLLLAFLLIYVPLGASTFIYAQF